MGFLASSFPNCGAARTSQRPVAPSGREVRFRSIVEASLAATYAPQWIDVEGVAWTIARVVTGEELRVTFDLLDAGYRAYTPRRREIQRRRPHPGATTRLRQAVVLAAFPGYVFVGAKAGVALGRGMHRDVVEMVCSGGAPLRIPAEMVALVNDREMACEWDEIARPVSPVRRGEPVVWAPRKAKAPFATGETVRVVDGPFAGFNGVVAALPPDLRVKVEMMIFGRATPVDYEACQIEKV